MTTIARIIRLAFRRQAVRCEADCLLDEWRGKMR